MALLQCIYILKDENYSSFIGEQEEKRHVIDNSPTRARRRRGGAVFHIMLLTLAAVYQASRISIEEWKMLHGREHIIISSCSFFM